MKISNRQICKMVGIPTKGAFVATNKLVSYTKYRRDIPIGVYCPNCNKLYKMIASENYRECGCGCFLAVLEDYLFVIKRKGKYVEAQPKMEDTEVIEYVRVIEDAAKEIADKKDLFTLKHWIMKYMSDPNMFIDKYKNLINLSEEVKDEDHEGFHTVTTDILVIDCMGTVDWR